MDLRLRSRPSTLYWLFIAWALVLAVTYWVTSCWLGYLCQ